MRSVPLYFMKPLFIIEELPTIDSDRKKALSLFQKNLSIKFKNLALLNLSFIHRSISNESDYKVNNERLEFLGDAILGAIAATLLYKKLTGKNEGTLAKIKSVVVSEDVLSGIAQELHIDSLLLLGRGEELSGGRKKKTILADALEALIGALYIDSGYNAAYKFVSCFIIPEIDRVLNNHHYKDYKSLLQELSQHLTKSNPVYKLLERSGPDHNRFFKVEVMINEKSYGSGSGQNKKSAEQAAAKIAFETLSKDE